MIETILICAAYSLFVAAACIYFIRWYMRRLDQKYQNALTQWKAEETSRIAKKSVEASKSTIRGQVSEQMFSLMPECDFNSADMRFLGDAADYIIFDGYSEVKDKELDDLREIVFVEIKSKKSRLSNHQKAVKRAIEAGRVRWETIRL